MKYPKGIKAVYDNRGESVDRYTIIFKGIQYIPIYQEYGGAAIASSSNPNSPQGIFDHVSAVEGKHLGKKISWLSLPKSVRNLVNKERLHYA